MSILRVIPALTVLWLGVRLAWGAAPVSPAPAASQPAASQPATSQAATSQAAATRPSIVSWDQMGSQGPLGVPDDRTTGMIWQMLAAVAVVLVLGGVGILVTKRLLPRLTAQAGRKVSVVETISLGPRKTVHLLHVGTRRYLLGAHREGVSMLADVTAAFPPDSREDASSD